MEKNKNTQEDKLYPLFKRLEKRRNVNINNYCKISDLTYESLEKLFLYNYCFNLTHENIKNMFYQKIDYDDILYLCELRDNLIEEFAIFYEKYPTEISELEPLGKEDLPELNIEKYRKIWMKKFPKRCIKIA